MSDITVRHTDGTVTRFPHEIRSGGSYTNHVRYEGAFAIITDVWGNETAFPCERIDSVRVEPRHRA